MTARSLKTYRVTLLESSSYTVEIEAKSTKAAEAKARAMWDCGKTEEFVVRETGLEYVDAQES